MKMNLKRHGLMVIVASLATCWFLASPEVASAAEKKSSPAPMQEMKPAGRLVVVRAPTLGATIVGLKVDGVEVGQISYNRRYDAPLAAGTHVLSVFPVNSLEDAKPSERQVTVESGRTYTFTAKRQDIQLVLK